LVSSICETLETRIVEAVKDDFQTLVGLDWNVQSKRLWLGIETAERVNESQSSARKRTLFRCVKSVDKALREHPGRLLMAKCARFKQIARCGS
jgi:hypothetical protein